MTVTIEQVAIALGVAAPEPDTIQVQQWQMWLHDAALLINNRAEKLGVVDLDAAKVDYVTREAVVAHIKRPEDATQVTVTVDDGSTSKSYKSGKGRVAILDEWWELLGLTEPEGAYSVDQVPGVSDIHSKACSLRFHATYCSCGADIAGVPIQGV